MAGVGFNSTLDRFAGITYNDASGPGFRIALSADGVSWEAASDPLVPNGTRWADAQPNLYGYGQYPSPIAPDGTKIWSTDFYLYYMYLLPGDDMTRRFGVRRRVTMTVGSAPRTDPGSVLIEVERYSSASTGRHWVTSELAIPARGVWDYRSEGSLGAAFTVPGPGLVEIDDCVYGDTNYLVSEAGGVCESPGQTKLRTIGWVFSPALAQPPGTHAVYRCYLPGSDDHFVSIDPACEGAQTEFLVGYLY